MFCDNAHAVSSTAPAVPPSAGASPIDDFLSLREVLAMILRHRWPVLIFVVLVTLSGGVFFLSQPREYLTEGYLQVIPPLSPEGRVDKDLFETKIVSHLQKASSAFLAKNVAAALQEQGIALQPLELQRKIKIIRPPKTDLIRITAHADSAAQSLLLVRLWIERYLESIQKNNISTALAQTRLQLQRSQAELMEHHAGVDQLQAQIGQSAPLITVLRSVDDQQLWSDLAQPAGPDAESLKKLSAIHIKGQEQSQEYLDLRNALIVAQGQLAAAQAHQEFYQAAEEMLEAHAEKKSVSQAVPVTTTNPAILAAAELYVKSILKGTEVVQFGTPGLISDSRGLLKKTGLVFLAALALASFAALLREWGRGLLAA